MKQQSKDATQIEVWLRKSIKIKYGPLRQLAITLSYKLVIEKIPRWPLIGKGVSLLDLHKRLIVEVWRIVIGHSLNIG
jgi:hypothetical protein